MPAAVELLLDALGGRLRERVVERRVGRRLGPLALGQLGGQPVRPGVALLVGRGLLGEEQVLEAAVEQLGRAAGGLDVEHPVALGDRRGGQVQQRGERAEQQVDLVLADQRVVVGDDRVLVRAVVLDHHLDVAPVDQAAVLVDERLPDLVALLGGLAGLRELARQRKRSADLDGLAAATAAAPPPPSSSSSPQPATTKTASTSSARASQPRFLIRSPPLVRSSRRDRRRERLSHNKAAERVVPLSDLLQTFAAIVCSVCRRRLACQPADALLNRSVTRVRQRPAGGGAVEARTTRLGSSRTSRGGVPLFSSRSSISSAAAMPIS